MATLKSKVETAGMNFRDASNQDFSTFGVQAVPTIIITNQDNEELKRYSGELVSMHQDGTLANTICADAESFK